MYRYCPEQFPVAERIYEGLLSLPLYPRMTDQDAADVSEAVKNIIAGHRVDGDRLSGKGALLAATMAKPQVA